MVQAFILSSTQKTIHLILEHVMFPSEVYRFSSTCCKKISLITFKLFMGDHFFPVDCFQLNFSSRRGNYQTVILFHVSQPDLGKPSPRETGSFKILDRGIMSFHFLMSMFIPPRDCLPSPSGVLG